MLDVLRQLAHADFRSGELIASRLGCSRSTVGNAIREAGEQGVLIHAVHGRGYRLVQPLTFGTDKPSAKQFIAAIGCFAFGGIVALVYSISQGNAVNLDTGFGN